MVVNDKRSNAEPRNAAVSDERVERAVGNLLRAGVLTAALVVATGAGIYLVEHGGQQPHYRTFQSEPQKLRSIPLAIHEALNVHGQGIIQVGLLLLIATPIARVVLAAIAFFLQHDALYVIVSLVVLSILCASLFGLTT